MNKTVTFMWYSNDTFHYMFKAGFVTDLKFKSPVGIKVHLSVLQLFFLSNCTAILVHILLHILASQKRHVFSYLQQQKRPPLQDYYYYFHPLLPPPLLGKASQPILVSLGAHHRWRHQWLLAMGSSILVALRFSYHLYSVSTPGQVLE